MKVHIREDTLAGDWIWGYLDLPALERFGELGCIHPELDDDPWMYSSDLISSELIPSGLISIDPGMIFFDPFGFFALFAPFDPFALLHW